MVGSDLVSVIGSTLIVALYTVIFMLWGNAILKKFLNVELNDQLALSMGFFLGATSFFSLWCYIELLTKNATLSLAIATLILIGTTFRNFNFKLFKNIFKLSNPVFWILFILCSILFFFARIYPFNFNIDAPLGSGSTMLYFNKTLFYYKNNIIPRSTNSIGQSLLAAIPLFWGFAKTGILNLFTWMYVCVIVFGIFAYGFFKQFNFSEKESYIGAFFLLFGNASLSLLPINVVDSGMPLILSNYSHPIITVVTFLSFLLFGYFYINNNLKINFNFLALTILTVTSWFITSPENVIIGYPFFITVLAYCFIKKEIDFKNLVKVSLFFVVLSVVGMTRGGLVSPAFFRDVEVEKSIPGHQLSPVGVPFQVKPGIDFSLQFALDISAFHYPTGQRFHMPNEQRDLEVVNPSYFKGTFTNRFMSKFGATGFTHRVARFIIWEFEFWHALKILFIPIIGIISLWIISTKNENKWMNLLSKASALAFLGGFILTFIPYQEGIKWPFTRFLLPGIIPAQICFFISLLWIANYLKPNKRMWAIMAIVLLLSIGQIAAISISAGINLTTTNQNGESVMERASKMYTTGEYVL